MIRPPQRRTATTLMLPAVVLISIVLHEGYIDRAVIPVKGDMLTIGFSTTIDAKLGDTTTPSKVLVCVFTNAQQFGGVLKTCVTVPLAQHEYDALAGFPYNVGSRTFCQSTLVRKPNAENYAEVCSELLRQCFSQGKDCALPISVRLCGGLAACWQPKYRQCVGEAP